MSAVLRGRNLPLEQVLGELAGAVQRQFPKHLIQIPGVLPAGHIILIPAFVNGELRLYTIELVVDRKTFSFSSKRLIANPLPGVGHTVLHESVLQAQEQSALHTINVGYVIYYS